MIASANSICCPWHTTAHIKCGCDDGTHVHPWNCCATGKCNIFCCNCQGQCRTSEVTTTTDTTTTTTTTSVPMAVISSSEKPVVTQRETPSVFEDGEVVAGSRDGEEATNIQKLSDGDTEITVEDRVKRSVLLSGLEGTVIKFRSLDLDGSNSLDIKEISRAMNKDMLNKLSDRDSSLARIFGSFESSVMKLAEYVLNEMDDDKDGRIQPAEFDKDLEGLM